MNIKLIGLNYASTHVIESKTQYKTENNIETMLTTYVCTRGEPSIRQVVMSGSRPSDEFHSQRPRIINEARLTSTT